MRKLFFCFIIFTTISCATSKKAVPNSIKEKASPIKVVATAVKDADGNLVGIATKNSFLVTPYATWFNPNYENYSVNEDVIEKLKPLLKNVTIKAFMGTWCKDSQEQIPVFYKALDNADFNYANLELIAVNRSKKKTYNSQRAFKIKRIPTFIFYRNGIEIGRFVEYPRESVEADIFKIMSGKPYKHSYEK